MNSIIQDWAAELGLRHQGVLVSAVRGCDGETRETNGKEVVRFYRACVLKAYCGHPRDAASYMIWPKGHGDLHRWAKDFFDAGMDHYPMHWLTHFMFAAEILGYHAPEPFPLDDEIQVKAFWNSFYLEIVRRLHLNPETQLELDVRLGRNEEDFRKNQ